MIGAQSFVGANSYVKSGFEVPARHLAAGSPARLVRELTDAELDWKTQGTRTYQQLTHRCRSGLRRVSPVTESEQDGASGQVGTTDSGWQHVTLGQYRSAGDTTSP